MAQFAVFKEDVIRPFLRFGLNHPFWDLNFHTVTATWIVLIALAALTLATKYCLKQPQNSFSFLVISFVSGFKDLVDQTLGAFHFRHFTFIASLFIFILTCNMISLIPGVEEPTSDIMTTLALGITAFLYTQYSSIQTNGLLKYLQGYLKPFFIMLPLNIISNLATIISISFRLFGNIFGGAVISSLWYGAISSHFIFEIIGILTGINLTITVFFILFEGFIQAFVFAMLSLTYLSLEVREEEPGLEKLAPESGHI
jgi:F-type H+-transporting ATPase subunit a